MDAVARLLNERENCCGFYNIITGEGDQEEGLSTVLDVEQTDSEEDEAEGSSRLNASQLTAVRSCNESLSLIWGPPGVFNILYMCILNPSHERNRDRKNHSCR